MRDQKIASQSTSALEPYKRNAQRQSKIATGQTGADRFAHLREFAMRKVEFFLDRGRYVDGADLAAALRLTAHFLNKRVLAPHVRRLPEARRRLGDYAVKNAVSPQDGESD